MPRKVSNATRALRGNTSGRPIRAPLAGEGDLWAPPKWFTAALREKWNYALETAPKGLLAGSDRDLLINWCVACVGYTNAAKAMLTEDAVLTNGNGTQTVNQHLVIMHRCSDTMIRLSKLLGFNPASRTVLGAVGASGYAQLEGSVASYLEEKPSVLSS
jgi:P27 family predicted phage terminase small subunit